MTQAASRSHEASDELRPPSLGVDRCPAPGRSYCVSADVTQLSLHTFDTRPFSNHRYHSFIVVVFVVAICLSFRASSPSISLPLRNGHEEIRATLLLHPNLVLSSLPVVPTRHDELNARDALGLELRRGHAEHDAPH